MGNGCLWQAAGDFLNKIWYNPFRILGVMKVKSEHESGDCDLCDFSSGNLDSISLRFYGHSETIQD